MLNLSDSVLIVIDVQGKLARVVLESPSRISQIQKLVKGMMILEVPVILTNQVPEKLGPTIEEIATFLPGQEQVSRTAFSVFREVRILNQLAELGRRQVILCGFETHICIHQSAIELKNEGFEVSVVVDATSSRHQVDLDMAIKDLITAGVKMTTVEMCLFELIKDARHPHFKDIAQLIK